MGEDRLLLESREIEPGTGHAAGRLLLEKLYRQATGEAMPPILATERGKPYFASGPLHFSVTHTRRRVFCALWDRPLGIDAEELDRKIDLRLADKILSAGELAQYQAADDKRLALLTFWVLKEAAAKASGQGLRGYPRDTDFSLEDPRVRIRDGCLLAVIPANITEQER